MLYRVAEVLAVVVALAAICALSLYFKGQAPDIKATLSGLALSSAATITLFALGALIYLRLKNQAGLKQLTDSWVFRVVGGLFVAGLLALVATSVTLPQVKDLTLSGFTKMGAIGLSSILALGILFYYRRPQAADPVADVVFPPVDQDGAGADGGGGSGDVDMDFDRAARQANIVDVLKDRPDAADAAAAAMTASSASLDDGVKPADQEHLEGMKRARGLPTTPPQISPANIPAASGDLSGQNAAPVAPAPLAHPVPRRSAAAPVPPPRPPRGPSAVPAAAPPGSVVIDIAPAPGAAN